MTQVFVGRLHPELRELVAEAASALARLDADRLEELALSCRMLCDHRNSGEAEERGLYRQAQEASPDVAILGGLLDATRANLRVLKQLRSPRSGELEYTGRH